MTKNVPGQFSGEGSGPIKQHQMIARGGAGMSGNFGAQQMASLSRGNGFSGQGSMKLPDGARGASTPVKHAKGKAPAQAAPDHGPSY